MRCWRFRLKYRFRYFFWCLKVKSICIDGMMDEVSILRSFAVMVQSCLLVVLIANPIGSHWLIGWIFILGSGSRAFWNYSLVLRCCLRFWFSIGGWRLHSKSDVGGGHLRSGSVSEVNEQEHVWSLTGHEILKFGCWLSCIWRVAYAWSFNHRN